MHTIPIDEVGNDIPAITGTAGELRNVNAAYLNLGIVKGLPVTPSLVVVEQGGKVRLTWLLDGTPSDEQYRAIASRLEQYGVTAAPQGTGAGGLLSENAVRRGSHDQGQSAGIHALDDVLNAFDRIAA